VDFEFNSVSEQDFHGVSLILKNVLGGEYNGASLADTIVEQQNIGTVVKTGEDSAICCLGTVLNPHQYNTVEGVNQVKSFILKNSQKHGNEKVINLTKRLFDPSSANTVPGIVLKERLVNLPLQLSPGLHKVLLDDIAWSLSTEAECPGDEIDFYRFTHYIFVSYFLVDPSSSSTEGRLVSQGKVKKRSKQVTESSRIYMHGEDETFLESAEGSFSWRVEDHDDSQQKYHKYRLVYVMTAEDYRSAVDRLLKAV
jgi:BCCIP